MGDVDDGGRTSDEQVRKCRTNGSRDTRGVRPLDTLWDSVLWEDSGVYGLGSLSLWYLR